MNLRFSLNQLYIIIICLLLFSITILIYSATGEGHPNDYNYYVRLSDAFLHGRLYLTDNPSWLNELVPNPSGVGYYVVYPPLPAILMIPLVAVFGLQFNQTIFSILFGAATVVLAYFVAKSVIKKTNFQGGCENRYVWSAVLFGFGTIFWWLASNGSVWLTAQVTGTFFMLLAINESFNKARPLLIGLFLGAAYWCRLPIILGIFFFAGLIVSRQNKLRWVEKLRNSLPSLTKLFLGAGFFVALNMAYNYARFETLFDVAYWMIPNILEEPWFNLGLFNLAYIPQNLEPFLFGLPNFTSSPPYIDAPITGIAIWFTTPAFIFALRSKLKNTVTLSAWVAIFAIAFIIFTKGLSGWGWGYRYAMDFYPFLYVLTVQGMGKKLQWYHISLIVLSVFINCWGTIAFNKF